MEDENFGLREKAQGEKEIKSNLIRATKSNEMTIESLIERNQLLESDNEKLQERCFEAAKLINDLGTNIAKLQDTNRELSQCRSELIEVVPDLQARLGDAENLNQSLMKSVETLKLENSRLLQSEAEFKSNFEKCRHAFSRLEQESEISALKLKSFQETEQYLNDRIAGKNDIIKQQSSQIANLVAKVEPKKQTANRANQTRKVEKSDIDCQTSTETQNRSSVTVSDQSCQDMVPNVCFP